MKPSSTRLGFVNQTSHAAVIIACIALLSAGNAVLRAQQTQPAPAALPPSATPAPEAPKIPNDQLDSLVSPIALYPDPLLAQTLAAATYPLEVIQLQQWLAKNPNLKDKALADAVAKQNWDPSIQAMAALPDVVKQLAENVAWTTDLGNAFLAQQADVMDAVQRMRTKAQTAGNLKPSKEQKVESKQVQGKTVVVIEQADPKVVYVPAYNPTIVYGPPVYPYPSIYYPPYVAGRVLAFGAGVAIGAAWNGNWGWNCGWGNNNVNINVNNNYINNFNKTNVNQRITNNSAWQHNGQHRGGAPYSNRTTAQKYGGTTRGDTLSNRQTTARSQLDSTRQRPATSDRSLASDRQKPALSDRSANAPSNRPQNRMSGDTDRIANRQVSKSPSPRTNNAFSGPSSGFDRSSAFASRDRGSRSMASSRSSGMRGGGRRR
ncbi:MAG TPA: DUF3300 domain-containing protein [Chthoniobacterales bacterium]|nr:DUF3300 domain-containing protein [Chthoniobacterales bacterium]